MNAFVDGVLQCVFDNADNRRVSPFTSSIIDIVLILSSRGGLFMFPPRHMHFIKSEASQIPSSIPDFWRYLSHFETIDSMLTLQKTTTRTILMKIVDAPQSSTLFSALS